MTMMNVVSTKILNAIFRYLTYLTVYKIYIALTSVVPRGNKTQLSQKQAIWVCEIKNKNICCAITIDHSNSHTYRYTQISP